MYGVDVEQSLIAFLITGFMGYNFFWSMVQSASQMGLERISGTLETIFLSPVNRLALVYGRALGALFENIWLFSVFSVFVLFSSGNITIRNILCLPVMFVVLVLSAMVWGGFMNVIFLFSRDASYLFNILDEPMVLFAGVRIPISAFPLWAKVISTIFPLTHSLILVRNLFKYNSLSGSIMDIIYLLITLLIMILLTIFLLKKAEKHARTSGDFTFY